MNRPKAALFDLDGTLVDSLDSLTDAANFTAARFGLSPATREVVQQRIGHGARALVARTVEDQAPLEDALEVFFARYRDVMHQARPFSGLLELMARLGRAGVIRGCATNKPAVFTTPILESTGFAPELEGWASGDEAERKPGPAALRLALDRAGAPGLAQEDVVYVGDMPVDVAAARNFGCPAIGVTWGLDPEGLREAAPDHLVHSTEQLAAALGL